MATAVSLVAALAPVAGVAAARPASSTACDATARPTFDTAPARQSLHRLLGSRADRFRLATMRGAGAADRYCVHASGARITVAATSNVALVTAANQYLKRVTHTGITWDGSSVSALPHRLPAPKRPVTGSTRFADRFAGNDVMSAYTDAYWGAKQWRHEIDVLAANGVNEVLDYPGQALVYQRTFQHFGYGARELRHWIPQPSHQPWWLLQNMSDYNEPISSHVLAAQARLGRQIADTARGLGMTPVFPGYFGTVPSDFARRHPGAHAIAQGTWNGLPRPEWLDPRDPMYAKIAATFYRTQDRWFGPTSMYKMDPLHEGGQDGGVPLPTAGHDIQAALRRAHPAARWAILGWQKNPRPELLAGVDKAKMLVVDGESDVNAGTDRDKDWAGTPYTYGTIWNFGGRTTIGANSTTWTREFPQWAAKPGSALRGIALMPEANDNNPFAFSLFTDLIWHRDGINGPAWATDYATWRYGGADPHAATAWRTMASTAYATPNNGSDRQPPSLFTAQPSLTATWGSPRYDAASFAHALPELLAVKPALRHTSAYRYDLVDVARQVLGNESQTLLPRIRAAYQAKDEPKFRALARRWLALMRLDDRLVGADPHFLLGRWLADARAAGTGRAGKDTLEFDARGLVTEWASPPAAEAALHDYANREWNGLLAFYTHRWQRYFAGLDRALRRGGDPGPINWYDVDNSWAHQHDRYQTNPRGDAHALAARAWRLASRTR